MNLLPWVLAGALASALIGDLRSSARSQPLQDCSTTCCTLDVAGLGLTAVQIDAVKSACAEAGLRLKTIASEEADLRQRLDAALDAAVVEDSAVRDLGRRLSAVRSQRLAALLECVLGVRRVLSAEQVRDLCGRCGLGSEE